MRLMGATERERIDSALAFAKAHRVQEADLEAIAEAYRKAGVPLTEAAERFCREWDAVLDCAKFYPDFPNVVMDDGTHYLINISFDFWLLSHSVWEKDAVESLRLWYEPTCYPDLDENFDDDIAGMIRSKYGADTVPVAKGGYYYPNILYIRPDGRIISVFADECRERHYDRIEEFLYQHLSKKGATRIELVLEQKDLEGTLEERILEAIRFAKVHGGFEHCRLFPQSYSRAPLDLTRLTGQEGLADADLAALILKILEENTPRGYRETVLPVKIEFVME